MSVEQCVANSPAAAWSNHVSARRPCIFRFLSTDVQGLRDIMCRDSLLKHAGTELVNVEERSDVGRAFGNGQKVRMTMAQFLDKLHGGSEALYLSTQAASVQSDGFPALTTPPLDRLVSHGLPLKPEVMGNLVPQAVNVWMGSSVAGASSGLHHDFHDNLYVLLHGTKHFRLFPPEVVDQMYPHGQVERVHPNGRIVYKGSGEVRADGSDEADVCRWRLKRRADAAATPSGAAVGQVPPLVTGGAGADTESDSGGGGDALMEAALEAALDAAGEVDFREEEDGLSSEDGGTAAGALRQAATCGRSTPAAQEATPDSFSKVDLSLPEAELFRRFPRFPGVSAAMEVTLQAGQMLYLPASWFHEVTSFSGNGQQPHVAVNYWFHPPDNIQQQSGEHGDRRFPYSTDFWPDMWNERVKRCGWPAALAVPLRRDHSNADTGSPGPVAGKRKAPDS